MYGMRYGSIKKTSLRAMADGPSVDVMVASGIRDDSAGATRTHSERAVMGLSKRCGPPDHPPRAAAVRLCLDNPAAKSSSHGEQDGKAGAMDTCGAAHTLDSMLAHTTAHATASAMPAHVLHESQPAEQTRPVRRLMAGPVGWARSIHCALRA